MLGDRFTRLATGLREAAIILRACVQAMDRGCSTADIVRTLAHAVPLHAASVGPFVAQPVVVVPPPSIAAYNGPFTYPCSNAQNATCHPAQKHERLKEAVTLVVQALEQEQKRGMTTAQLDELIGVFDILLILHK